ncbi:hypothetical protein EIN_096020 [Entamoeba invadens IP1]|uniref:EF-hand domain-containing protein n=1 Tax=Entamoeba invadens IP1 TaxID=370355 RepID=A0A0A1U0C7_ENTIV|nr:hypothetical protein EIN_096020 [Entamoeba invadens IP1]ELP87345.1 hypothetical protein EIN_096020 [Entamoeba invadens IP1]|eukprot:XP_004254116.1 hypothetical protein EIN_096020 [Entamoeba invadens IP1]
MGNKNEKPSKKSPKATPPPQTPEVEAPKEIPKEFSKPKEPEAPSLIEFTLAPIYKIDNEVPKFSDEELLALKNEFETYSTDGLIMNEKLVSFYEDLCDFKKDEKNEITVFDDFRTTYIAWIFDAKTNEISYDHFIKGLTHAQVNSLNNFKQKLPKTILEDKLIAEQVFNACFFFNGPEKASGTIPPEMTQLTVNLFFNGNKKLEDFIHFVTEKCADGVDHSTWLYLFPYFDNDKFDLTQMDLDAYLDLPSFFSDFKKFLTQKK